MISKSQRSGLNRRPLDYESSALPLSYAGGTCYQCVEDALARTRTATPCGTTPSRWRVYQFHHQGNDDLTIYCVTEPTGLEPATSRVTVECSNQTELRLLLATLAGGLFEVAHAARALLVRTARCLT